jgi:hypothetical protein
LVNHWAEVWEERAAFHRRRATIRTVCHVDQFDEMWPKHAVASAEHAERQAAAWRAQLAGIDESA